MNLKFKRELKDVNCLFTQKQTDYDRVLNRILRVEEVDGGSLAQSLLHLLRQ